MQRNTKISNCNTLYTGGAKPLICIFEHWNVNLPVNDVVIYPICINRQDFSSILMPFPFHHLEAFSASIIYKLGNVVTSISFYQTLKLSACKYLTDSSLDALYKECALPALCELDLSYSSIGQSAIAELLACCTNLVHVNLNGCANMHELVWGSNDFHSLEMPSDVCPPNLLFLKNGNGAFRKSEHLLETLNCTGCPNIKKVLIPSMVHCFHLSKINLNLSTNLKEVVLACYSLSTLNLRLVFLLRLYLISISALYKSLC